MLSKTENNHQPDKQKKNVSWIDNQSEGQISKEFLEVGTAATSSQEILENEINELVTEGFSEIEATAMVGKPITPSGELLLNNPIFYESREEIEQQKANRYGFFSMQNIVLGGAVTLAAAATIGFMLGKK